MDKLQHNYIYIYKIVLYIVYANWVSLRNCVKVLKFVKFFLLFVY